MWWKTTPVPEPLCLCSGGADIVDPDLLVCPHRRVDAALKCLQLVSRSLDPTGTGRTRRAMCWKPALNAFAITFGCRFPAAETFW
jgi:hypothetical protein